MAQWSNGTEHYLMAKFVLPSGTADEYRCFIYQEEDSDNHQYSMSQTGSEVCGALGRHFEKTYKIFGESKGIK